LGPLESIRKFEEKESTMPYRRLLLSVVALVVCVTLVRTTECGAAPAVTEYPIATGTAEEISNSAAFDGTNYLVGIQGNDQANYNITAQLVSQSGSLIGSRISIGRTGGVPAVAFDGTNFLMVWSDNASSPMLTIYGQFINRSGAKVGTPFPISKATANPHDFHNVVFDGANYLVIWTDGRLATNQDTGPWYVYGQLVSKSGKLTGGEIKISSAPGHYPALAFDGTNYLVAWVENTNDRDYYGQFISAAGALAGSNFLIDGNSYPSGARNRLLFAGNRYVLTVHDQISAGTWAHYVRFISLDGTIWPDRIKLYEGQTAYGAFVLGFDGTNYVALLSDGAEAPPITSKARFYDYQFSPQGDWFSVGETKNGKVPVGPFLGFNGCQYVGMMSRFVIDNVGPNYMSQGDVYGVAVERPRHARFPVATTTADEQSISAAFDGVNYLFGIRSKTTNEKEIQAQMVSRVGTLVGSRISVARNGDTPQVAFAGTNYLMIWADYANYPNDDIYGQVIDRSGAKVGSAFPISTAAGEQRTEIENIAAGGGNYLVVWQDGRVSQGPDAGPWYIYGQVISQTGALVGGEIKISGTPGRLPSLAFDGTNFLVVWVEDTSDKSCYGQFISPTGGLVGSNFVIDSNDLPSDNPTYLIFDGTRYVMTLQDQLSADTWGQYVRLIKPDGTVLPQRVTLFEGPMGMGGCFVFAFDGTHYLAGRSEPSGSLAVLTAKGRFYDQNFAPASDWIIIAETEGTKVPVGPIVHFDGSRYYGAMFMGVLGSTGFEEADAYGLFIRPLSCRQSIVSGYVRTPDGRGVPGVVLAGLPWFPTTDSNGYYRATIPSGWSLLARPLKPHCTFVPETAAYTYIRSDQTQDYTASCPNAGFSNVLTLLLADNPDTDGDGMPDSWEIANGLNPNVNDAGEDPDGDGLTSLREYQLGTNPKNADTDGDGMPDGWEVQHGLDPKVDDCDADPDRDGWTNCQEYVGRTDPMDQNSHPSRGLPWIDMLLGE